MEPQDEAQAREAPRHQREQARAQLAPRKPRAETPGLKDAEWAPPELGSQAGVRKLVPQAGVRKLVPREQGPPSPWEQQGLREREPQR